MNILAGIYLSAGLAGVLPCPDPPSGEYWQFDINRTHNPYAIAALGWEYDFSPRWRLNIEGRHMSSPRNDIWYGGNHGVTDGEARITWHPFR